jgi:hypothetical protein
VGARAGTKRARKDQGVENDVICGFLRFISHFLGEGRSSRVQRRVEEGESFVSVFFSVSLFRFLF